MKSIKKKLSIICASMLAVSIIFQPMVLADESDNSGETSVSVTEENESSAESSKPEESSKPKEESSKPKEKPKTPSKPKKPNTSNLENKLQKLKEEEKKIQASINGLKGEKANEQAILNQTKNKIANVQSQIDIVDQQINSLNGSITKMNGEINNLNNAIAEREKQIEEKEKEFDDAFALFKDRIVTMYKYGQANSLEVFLGTEDFSSMLAGNQYMKYITKKDQDMMDELTEIKEAIIADKEKAEQDMVTIEENKKNIESQKATQQSKKKEQLNLKSELDNLKGKSETVINGIDSQVNGAMQDMNLVKKEAAQVEAEIQKLITDNANPNAEYVGGEFLWPVPGFTHVSCGYGCYPGHSGMDITGNSKGAIAGANIVAANDGTVIAVIRNSTGYGYYTIIDHGGGRTTLYAHCSSISVSKGQKVKRGQVIANVGTTGNSSGYHLHFEVRINGAPQNPAGYLK